MKNTDDDYDCMMTAEIVCPYCKHEECDSWEFREDEGEHECPECGKSFEWVRSIEVSYSTYKKNKEKK